jgi:hypothetical protein
LGVDRGTSPTKKAYLRSTFAPAGIVRANIEEVQTREENLLIQEWNQPEEPPESTVTGNRGEEAREEKRTKDEEDKEAQ